MYSELLLYERFGEPVEVRSLGTLLLLSLVDVIHAKTEDYFLREFQAPSHFVVLGVWKQS